jgi:hypothetical protein
MLKTTCLWKVLQEEIELEMKRPILDYKYDRTSLADSNREDYAISDRDAGWTATGIQK